MRKLTKFEQMELIYQGPQLNTYLATIATTGQAVWVKSPKSDHPFITDLEKLKWESDISGKLSGNGFPQFSPPYREEDRWISLAENPCAQGMTLRHWIDSFHKPVSLEEALQIGLSTIKLLEAFHRLRLVHHHLNPSSLWLDPSTYLIYPLDYSMTREIGGDHTAVYSSLRDVQDFVYLSPESTGNVNEPIDFRSDIYGFGVILYELLTGQSPIHVHSASEWLHAQVAQTAPAPHLLKSDIPLPISDLVMTCLQNSPEDRYQSTYGLRFDLEAALKQLRVDNWERFRLKKGDTPSTLQVDDIFAGRLRELDELASLLPGKSNSSAKLILVSGEPGIGKTSLVRELQKRSDKEYLFVYGKFEQLNRDLPFHAWIDAFHQFVNHVLTQSETEIAAWKTAFLEELGSDVMYLAALLPKIELIIGTQPRPEPTAIPPSAIELEHRFNTVIERLFRVFPKRNYSVVVILDDIQWADMHSIKLIEHIFLPADSNSYQCIGIYRDKGNHGMESMQQQALSMLLRHQEEQGVYKLVLDPLKERDIADWLSGTLRRQPEELRELASLLSLTSGGNPLFLKEYLHMLYAKNIIGFNLDQGSWDWDLEQVKQAGSAIRSNEVADLLIARLSQLPFSSLQLIKAASCMGMRFDLSQVSSVIGMSILEANNEVTVLARLGLVAMESDACMFAHDRIQQTVYSMMSMEETQRLHYSLGKLMLGRVEADSLENDQLFAIVNQLNKGSSFYEPSDHFQLAQLNLRAGHSALQAAAFDHALRFYRTGAGLLPAGSWSTHYQMTYELLLGQAECAFLMNCQDEAERVFQQLDRYVKEDEDRTHVIVKQIMLYARTDQYDQSISLGLTALSTYGLHVPRNPSRLLIFVEWLKLQRIGRHIQRLAHAPQATDRRMRQVMTIISALGPATYLVNQDLMLYLAMRANRLTFRHGIFPNSGISLAAYGAATLTISGNIESGIDWGKMAWRLANQYGTLADKCYTSFMYGAFLHHWGHPPIESELYLERSINYSIESGDLAFVGYGSTHLILSHHMRGVPLHKLAEDVERYARWTIRLKDPHFTQFLELYQAFLHNMQGKTLGLYSLDYENFREADYVSSLHDDRKLFDYWLCKTQICYLHGHLDEALRTAKEAQRMIDAFVGTISIPEQDFYYCMVMLAQIEMLSGKRRKSGLAVVRKKLKRFEKWEKLCPTHYTHKALLIKAELARIMRDDLLAASLYQGAVDAASASGYLHNEAIAHECAARFYLDLGNQRAYERHLLAAYRSFLVWGAHAKVQLMLKDNPWLHEASITIASVMLPAMDDLPFADSLDIAAVLQASRALTDEFVLEDVLKNLLMIAIQRSGADRAILLLNNEREWLIAARGSVENDGIAWKLLEWTPFYEFADMAQVVVKYAIRTGEMQELNLARNDGRFAEDHYLAAQQVPSLLCMPIVLQGKTTGLLYLENSKAAGVFTPARIAVLKLLSSQIAISVQNALLYDQLKTENVQLAGTINETALSLERSRKEAAAALLENAILEERNRIAGEIHDTVGHTLTSVLVQIEAGMRLIGKHAPDAPMEKLENAMRHTREGLMDLRRSLYMLNDEATRLGESLPDFASFLERTMSYTGIKVQYDISPDLHLTPAQKYVFYRALQEGITNGIRHGQSERFTFILQKNEREIYFLLQDNGKGSNHIKFGLGLTAMRDRVHELGGEIQLNSTPGNGCTLMIHLPI